MPESIMAESGIMEEDSIESVRLEPFVHQVGGHSSMMQFNENTVCKPLINREQNFYETMPEEMKEFTPEFRGVIEVKFVEDRDGYLNLVALPSEQHGKTITSPCTSPTYTENGQSDSDSESLNWQNRQRFRMQDGSVEMEGRENMQRKSVTKHSLSAGPNPWSVHCHKAQLEKMSKSDKKSKVHKFMLLENLTWRFKLPCILDLKMGTRQHGDDASEEKRRLHMQKCESSTSSTVGARICGMQLYRADKGQYICHDKYYGRQLTVQGMRDTLHQFLHNGLHLRYDLLEPIIDRLKDLHNVLSNQNTFRFYSSSLLIMYDGAENGMSGLAQCSACRNVISGVVPGTSSSKHDATCGLQIEDPLADPDSDCSMMGDEDSRDSTIMGGAVLDTSTSSEPPFNSPQISYCRHVTQAHNSEARVDVRMIDFAHVTYKGFRGDKLIHNGPDRGYLFGLENLIQMFTDIKQSFVTGGNYVGGV